MIGLLQRVTQASVTVNDEVIASINSGLLALIGVEKNDSKNNAERLFQKIISYRIFADNKDKMNLSLQDVQGGLLLVPQFTLPADTRKGLRPSFSSAAPPELGKQLFELLADHARKNYATVETGIFGIDMKVGLVNDGPVTFWLQV